MEGKGLSRKWNHLCDGHKVCEPDPGGSWNCRAERTRWSLVEDEAREVGRKFMKPFAAWAWLG